MNKLRFILPAMILPFTLSAQNLIPNNDFENMLRVPTGYLSNGDMEHIVSDWHQGAMSTSDIVTTKSTSSGFPNPGTQTPHSGDVMGHMICGPSENWVEYFGATLTEPMEVGRKYYVEAYVLLANNSNKATNNFGFYFETGTYKTSTSTHRTEKPQVNYTEVISDKNNWTKISGFFVADQPYTCVTFGHFVGSPSQYIDVACTTNCMGARYFVDDMVVKAAGLSATGDTLVNTGAVATLTAKGGEQYKWVDIRNPNVVLGTDAVLKTPVSKRTTFRVSSGEETVELTVNVKHVGPVYQDELLGRKVRKGRNVIVHSTEITVSVHDKNEVDGDSISLYYGDSLIVQHLALTKKKQSFTFTIDTKNPKQVILYAENLGSVPPNTAELTIKAGKESTDIVLGSDFKWCDSVMLMYKE